jgi:hypothetical protein
VVAVDGRSRRTAPETKKAAGSSPGGLRGHSWIPGNP